ncbi:MAG TPA: DUF1385 domain-containing protein [Terriglobales bacterium]|nr:DUF1385 domain-containing protein [Terriglobales bacterium]
MKSIQKWIKPALREALHMQLLIALESGESEILVGGQAVMEGVMMRAPHSYAVAVRRSDGTISTTTRPLLRPSEKHKVWGWPLLRGLATLGQAMGLGVRALRFSSELMMADESGETAATKPSEVGKWGMIASIAASVVFFIAFYKFVPLLLATETAKLWPSFSGQIAFNLVDGVVRIVLFLAFIGGLALLPDIRRVYEYHGAEHKVVFNYESGQPVDVEHARGFTTLHPRCGTSFMIVIMLIAMAVYIAIPATTFWMRFGVRIALLPVIAGISYEVIRFGAKHNQSVFALLARPGLWLQRITTVEPSDGQLECSIHALETAMSLEKEQGGDLVIA